MAKGIGKMMNLDGLFGLGVLDGIVEDVTDLAVMAGAGTVAALAGTMAVNKTPWLKDQNAYIKGAALMVAGAAGGIAVGRYAHRAAGAGVGAGLMIAGLTRIGAAALPTLFAGSAMGALVGSDYRGDDLNGLSDGDYNGLGLTAGEWSKSDELVPLGATVASTPDPLRALNGSDALIGA